MRCLAVATMCLCLFAGALGAEGVQSDDPPTWRGMPLSDGFVLFLNFGEQSDWRRATLIAETRALLHSLPESSDFDLAVTGPQYPGVHHNSRWMWGATLPATDANRQSALAWVDGLRFDPAPAFPTYVGFYPPEFG